MASRMTEVGYQWGVKALQKRRSEIAGDIAQLTLRLKHCRHDLGKVDDILRILAPGKDPTRIPPKKAIRYLNLFRPGELGRLIIAILRAENRPMTNLEITRAIFDRGGFDLRLWSPIRRRCRANLAYLHLGGRIEKADAGSLTRWSLRQIRG